MDVGEVSSRPRSVEVAELGLAESRRRVDAQVRRGRRFSWFAWGFLFAFGFGEVLVSLLFLLFPMVTTTVSGSGTSTTSAPPAWGVIVAFAPAAVLLGLAVRELVLGRREARGGPPPGRTTDPDPSNAPPWIEEIRVAQQRLTRGASEIEWSFVPLVLGFIAFAELGVASGLASANFSGAGLTFVIPSVAGLLIGIVPLWPLYRIAKQWIRAGQERLELQSRRLVQLEVEFLWRFAGSGATP
jgi:hypothetical protein